MPLLEENEGKKNIKLILNELREGHVPYSSRNLNLEDCKTAYTNRDTKSFLYNNNSNQQFNTLKVNRPGTSSIRSTVTRTS